MNFNLNLPEKVNRITFLIEKNLDEQMTSEEEMELNAWLTETEQNRIFFQQITNKTNLKEKLKIYSSTDSESIWKKTMEKINGGKIVAFPESKIFRIQSRGFRRLWSNR
jgi:transmembrane sensor